MGNCKGTRVAYIIAGNGRSDAGHPTCRRNRVAPAVPPRLEVRGWRISSALTVCEFEVHLLLVVPGSVCGLQADEGGDNVEVTVTHDRPLVLRVWQLYKPAALQPIVAVRLAAGAPQRRDAGSRPKNGSEAESSFKRGDAPLVIDATRGKFAYGSLIAENRTGFWSSFQHEFLS